MVEHPENENAFHLKTVDNPDLPPVDKPAIGPGLRTQIENRYEDVNEAIALSWIGIVLAGALYPISIFVVGFAARLIVQGIPRGDLSMFLVNMIMFVFLSTLICLLAAILASTCSVAITACLNLSLGSVFSPRIAVSVCGGMAGFVATLPLWSLFSDARLITILLAFLGMVMGHVGGIIAVWKIEQNLFHHKATENDQRYQFQIRHLFVATAWIALIVALDRFTEGYLLIRFVLLWCLFQIILIVADRCWLICMGSIRRRRVLSSKSSL